MHRVDDLVKVRRDASPGALHEPWELAGTSPRGLPPVARPSYGGGAPGRPGHDERTDPVTDNPTSSLPRVLVVDDEEHITEMLAMGLGYQGFDVERAASGREALDAVVRQTPQLIVLDVMLPDLDGFTWPSGCAGTKAPATASHHLPHRPRPDHDKARASTGQRRLRHQAVLLEDLIERVRAILRRSVGGPAGGRPACPSPTWRSTRTPEDVWRARSVHRAHTNPVRLLHYLLANAQRCSPASRSSSTCGTTPSPATPACWRRTSATCARKVDATEPHLIHTVRGVGLTRSVSPAERTTGTRRAVRSSGRRPSRLPRRS